MAKFNTEQGLAVTEVQQLISEWAYELDMHNGVHIASLLTDDCTYMVGGAASEGRAAVEKFYRERLERLSAQPTGAPTQRHTLSNLRVNFRTGSEVSITFSLVFYTEAGMASGTNHADPAAVADVRMDCRRDDDGHWRIAKFDSNQTFRRIPA
jgi:hypothetical protein